MDPKVIAETPAADLPVQVGSLKKKVKETPSEWKDRLLRVMLDRAAKEAEKARRKAIRDAERAREKAEAAELRKLQREEAAEAKRAINEATVEAKRLERAMSSIRPEIENMRKELGLSEDEVHGLIQSEPEPIWPDGISLLESGNVTSLGPLRMDMMSWVIDSLPVKMAEAQCDLDCLSCPTARVMTCAGQNLSTLVRYGFSEDVIHTPWRFDMPAVKLDGRLLYTPDQIREMFEGMSDPVIQANLFGWYKKYVESGHRHTHSPIEFRSFDLEQMLSELDALAEITSSSESSRRSNMATKKPSNVTTNDPIDLEEDDDAPMVTNRRPVPAAPKIGRPNAGKVPAGSHKPEGHITPPSGPSKMSMPPKPGPRPQVPEGELEVPFDTDTVKTSAFPTPPRPKVGPAPVVRKAKSSVPPPPDRKADVASKPVPASNNVKATHVGDDVEVPVEMQVRASADLDSRVSDYLSRVSDRIQAYDARFDRVEQNLAEVRYMTQSNGANLGDLSDKVGILSQQLATLQQQMHQRFDDTDLVGAHLYHATYDTYPETSGGGYEPLKPADTYTFSAPTPETGGDASDSLLEWMYADAGIQEEDRHIMALINAWSKDPQKRKDHATRLKALTDEDSSVTDKYGQVMGSVGDGDQLSILTAWATSVHRMHTARMRQ